MVATKPYFNRNFQIKNLLTLSMTLTVSTLLFFQYFIDYNDFSFLFEKFVFLKDPLLYITLSLNCLSQYLARKTEKYNERNLIFSQFANFVLIALVPVFSYFVIKMFHFENTIEVSYNNIFEMFGISSILFILSFLFFSDKMKSKSIVRVDVLIAFMFVSTLNFVLINKLMQMYNTEAVYFCSMFFNSIVWIAMAGQNKEVSMVEKRHLPMFVLFGFVYIFYSYINIIIVNFLPSEHIAIFKTLSAVLSTAFFDFLRAKKLTLNKKDLFILFLIFATLFLFKT
jgi:hypothetical protein